jgi:hypothetical protein
MVEERGLRESVDQIVIYCSVNGVLSDDRLQAVRVSAISSRYLTQGHHDSRR